MGGEGYSAALVQEKLLPGRISVDEEQKQTNLNKVGKGMQDSKRIH